MHQQIFFSLLMIFSFSIIDTSLHAAATDNSINAQHANGTDNTITSEMQERFFTACKKGDEDEINRLFFGLKVNYKQLIQAKGRLNNTALHYAVHAGHLSIVRDLINFGADVNAKNEYEATPLHMASSQNPEIIRLLLKAGSYINAQDIEGRTRLHLAAENNDYTMVGILVEAGADVNCKDYDNLTPLHYTLNISNPESLVSLLLHQLSPSNCESLVRLLLQNGALVDAQSSQGYSPLFLNIAEGGDLIRNILLEYNANVNVQDCYGWTPLLFAASRNDTKTVITLLKEGADVNVQALYNYTPLHHAFHYCTFDVSRKYLKAKVHHFKCPPQEKKYTPLHFAIKHNNVSMVDTLIEVGADITLKNSKGETSLAYAERKNQIKPNVISRAQNKTKQINPKIIHLLQTATDKPSLKPLKLNGILIPSHKRKQFLNACVENKPFIVKQIIAQFSDNPALLKAFLDHEGALYYAASSKSLEIAKAFLEVGADPHIMGPGYNTSLCIAAQNNDLPMVQLLLDAHAPVTSIQTIWDFSPYEGIYKDVPLHYAVMHDNSEMVRLFLEAGALVSNKNYCHQTALDVAYQRGNKKIITLLETAMQELEVESDQEVIKKHEAFIDACKRGLPTAKKYIDQLNDPHELVKLVCMQDDLGRTALHYASIFKHADLVTFLLNHGASAVTHVQDIAQRTALHYICLHNTTLEIAALLLPYDTHKTFDMQDKDGNTPLHFACKNHCYNIKLVELLLQYGAQTHIKNKDGISAYNDRQKHYDKELTPIVKKNYEKQMHIKTCFTKVMKELSLQKKDHNKEALDLALNPLMLPESVVNISFDSPLYK